MKPSDSTDDFTANVKRAELWDRCEFELPSIYNIPFSDWYLSERY